MLKEVKIKIAGSKVKIDRFRGGTRIKKNEESNCIFSDKIGIKLIYDRSVLKSLLSIHHHTTCLFALSLILEFALQVRGTGHDRNH